TGGHRIRLGSGDGPRLRGHRESAAIEWSRLAVNATERWIDPGTAQAYPFAYDAYRRLREAQDRRLARHQVLGAQVDRHVWRRWRVRATASVDVLLTVRGASPRLRRMVAAILASIRRGHPPDEA